MGIEEYAVSILGTATFADAALGHTRIWDCRVIERTHAFPRVRLVINLMWNTVWCWRIWPDCPQICKVDPKFIILQRLEPTSSYKSACAIVAATTYLLCMNGIWESDSINWIPKIEMMDRHQHCWMRPKLSVICACLDDCMPSFRKVCFGMVKLRKFKIRISDVVRAELCRESAAFPAYRENRSQKLHWQI